MVNKIFMPNENGDIGITFNGEVCKIGFIPFNYEDAHHDYEVELNKQDLLELKDFLEYILSKVK